MHFITCEDWTEVEFSEREEYTFAQTNDPRVLAVIQRDSEGVTVSQQYDGDAINPILYREYRGNYDWVAGYDDGSASIINRAFDQLDDEVAERYLWIFHGIVLRGVTGGYDRQGEWYVVCSNAYLEHIGNEPYATREDALDDTSSIAQDLEWALDGYIYGIGYAVLEERVLHDDEPIQLEEWDINIGAWGHVGEECAKRAAAAFEWDSPDLPELLDLEVDTWSSASSQHYIETGRRLLVGGAL